MSSSNARGVLSIILGHTFNTPSVCGSTELTMDSATAPSTVPASSTPPENTPVGECYIDRLPFELLAAILEEHSALELRAPFVDSQVCRRWHETTQFWPKAWSYITMRSITEHKIPLNRLKTLLERSRDRPLHVNLEYLGSALVEPNIPLLFQRPAITRIQTLFLKGSLPDEIPIVESMPNLRILQLIQCDCSIPNKFSLGTKSFPLLDELVGSPDVVPSLSGTRNTRTTTDDHFLLSTNYEMGRIFIEVPTDTSRSIPLPL